MPTPVIRVNGNAPPPLGSTANGTITKGANATLTIASDARISSVQWSITRPVGSTCVIATPNPTSPFNTVVGPFDVEGTYLITCVANGNQSGDEVATAAVAVLTDNQSLRIPAVGEQFEWNASNGWHSALEETILAVDAGSFFDPASPGPIGGTTPGAGTFTALTVTSEIALTADGTATIQPYNADPNGVINANVGSVVLDTASGYIWSNVDGATDWARVAWISDFVQLSNAGTYASRPSAASLQNGARYTATDSPVADWVCVSGVWRPIVDGVVGTEVPASSWSWVNQGSATVDESNGAIYLATPSTGSNQLRARVRSLPSAPYTITACLAPCFRYETTAFGNASAGLALRDSAGGGLVFYSLTWVQSTGTYILQSQKWSSATSASTSYKSVTVGALGPRLWLRIVDDNTNRVLHYSCDGRNFTQFHSVGRADHITPDQYGLCLDAFNHGAALTALSLSVS